MMRTRKLSLIFLSLLTALCLSVGIISFLPKSNVRAEGEAVVVADNFLDTETDNHYYEKSNMYTNNNDKGDVNMGYIPVTQWGSAVFTTDGYMTYRIKSDSGYVFNGLSIDATVGAGHSGGLFMWQSALSGYGENYRWSGPDMVTVNMYIYVSADNQNWTPAVYTLANGNSLNAPTGNIASGATDIKESSQTNLYNVSVNLDSGSIPSSDELYVKFYFEHPDTNEYPIKNFDEEGIAYNRVGLKFDSVSITGTQAAIPSSLTVRDDFNDASEQKDYLENVNMISERNKGHATWGFVPSTGTWDGTVTLPDTAYLTYRLSATKGCYITSLDLDAYVTLCHGGVANDWGNATIKVMASYDNISYFELYDLRADATIQDKWVDGSTYYGEKGEGCLNGGDYLQGNLSGMSSAPPSIPEGLSADVRYNVVKTFDNSVLSRKTDTIYIRLLCSNIADPISRFLGQCPTRFHNVEFTINQAALEGVEIHDNMTTNTAKTAFAVNNVVSSGNNAEMYNEGFGWVPAKTWGEPAVGVGTGTVTYLLAADAGAVLRDVNFSMNYKMFSSDATKHANGSVDMLVKVSTDGVNYTTVYSEYSKNGIDTDSAKKTLSNLDLSSYAQDSNVLFIQIEMVCPEEASQNLNKIPVTLLGVDIVAGQKMIPVATDSINQEFGTDAAGGAPTHTKLVDRNNVVNGNETFGLIPTDVWGGTVNIANGYLTYKVSAGENKKLGTLYALINAEVMSGGNIVVSTSSDGTSFKEVYNLANLKTYDESSTHETNIAFTNPYKWHKGAVGEERGYQKLAINLGTAIANYSEAYVKIALEVPSRSVDLNAVPVKIFSIDLFAEVTERVANTAYITYETYGGVNAASNPAYYQVGDVIELAAPTFDGMTFIGWYDNDEYTGDPITMLDTTTLKDYRLYAKWDSSLQLNLTLVNAGNLVQLDGAVAQSKAYDFELRDSFTLTFGSSAEKYLYTVVVDGTEVDLVSNTYTVSSLRKSMNIVVTYQDRDEIVDNYTATYEQFKEGENGWKIGSYDFNNLKMTKFDSNFGLGPKASAQEGYITYKVVAPSGKQFNAVLLDLRAKLSNWAGTGRTDDYYVDVYFGTTEPIANGYTSFTKIKELPIGTGGGDYNVNTNIKLMTEGEVLSEFYIQIRIKSLSSGWLLLRNFNVDASEYKFNQMTINFVKADTTLAPQYIYNQYTGQVFDTSKVIVPEGYALEDGKFYTDSSCTTEYDLTEKVLTDTVLYVKVVAADGNITYVLDGGVNSVNNPNFYTSTTAITLEDATKDGYTFGGWYFDAEFTLLFTEIAQGRKGNITLYAKWVSNTLPPIEAFANVSYELNGGVNASGNPVMYFYGETTALSDPSYEGMVFLGWYLTSDFSGNAITKISATQTGNITLYAKWGETTASISYELNGGVNHSSNPVSYNYGETTALYDPTYENHVFLGWYLTSDFSGDAITEISDTQVGDITLYAKWVQNSYNISYELNGGTNDSTNPATYNYGVGVASIGDATRSHYDFLGWYITSDFSGGAITEISDTETGDITLYAKWGNRYITVTYVLDGGTNATINESKLYSGAYLVLGEPTKEGFIFDGFYDANGNYVEQIIVDDTSEDITLTATWKVDEAKTETEGSSGCGSSVDFVNGALIGAMVLACGVCLVVARKKKAK